MHATGANIKLASYLAPQLEQKLEKCYAKSYTNWTDALILFDPAIRRAWLHAPSAEEQSHDFRVRRGTEIGDLHRFTKPVLVV